MNAAQPQVRSTAILVAGRSRAWWRPVVEFIRYKPMGAVGGAILLFLVIVALLAPILAPENPNLIQSSRILDPPSSAAWFGRDGSGRDIFSRIMYGAQVSVGVGFSAVLISTVIKVAIGLVSAYRLGWTDLILQRFVDGFQALPQLVFLLAAATVLGQGVWTLIFLLGILTGIRGSRVIRGAVLGVVQNDYITAAKALGASDSRILLQHILPNIFAPIMVLATVNLGAVILTEASLSFLNLGIPPPTVSWGQMLSAGGYYGVHLAAMMQAPWIALAPGLSITAAVWGINMLGDALRDVLDPRLRGAGGGGANV